MPYFFALMHATLCAQKSPEVDLEIRDGKQFAHYRLGARARRLYYSQASGGSWKSVSVAWHQYDIRDISVAFQSRYEWCLFGRERIARRRAVA